MNLFVTMGIALGLGLMIGLQREKSEARLGGIRTFPLISLFGTFCGWLAGTHGAWILGSGLLAVFGLLALSNFLKQRDAQGEAGQTTEMAALLTFAIGAYLVHGNRNICLVAAGVVVILLHLKEPMHRFVQAMGEQDIKAVMQFVVMTLIIMSLLPDREYGPYKVLNPFDLWRMVVLIVGISLAGYIAYKIMGRRAGTIVGGLLGGLISSTATTVSYARRSREAPSAHYQAAFVIMAASSVAFVRVLIEIGAVAPGQFNQMAPALAAMLGFMILISLVAFMVYRGHEEELPEPENPAELKAALVFAAIYGGVLLAVGAVRHHFGTAALYPVAFVSGLTDMDAITLSMSRMVAEGRVDVGTGWRLVLVASLSNLVFKGAAVALLGDWRLALRVATLFGIAIAGGVLILIAWP